MLPQSEKRIAIITDSTCDLPDHYCMENDVHVMPLLLNWGEEALWDGEDIDADTFYARLETDPVHPTTSQPSPGEFATTFERIGQDADEIVAIFVSEKLSGTIASARMAVQMVGFPVHIVDSKTVSLGLGAVVMAAVEARDRVETVEAIVRAAVQRAENTRSVIMVDTLEFLHRGGRIGGGTRWVGTALQLKPVLHLVDGYLEPVARVRTRRRAITHMLEVAAEGLDLSAPLGGAVLHSASPADAEELAVRYQARYEPRELTIAQVTPIIGVHVGAGAMGLITYVL